jgi:hypothetical protein
VQLVAEDDSLRAALKRRLPGPAMTEELTVGEEPPRLRLGCPQLQQRASISPAMARWASLAFSATPRSTSCGARLMVCLTGRFRWGASVRTTPSRRCAGMTQSFTVCLARNTAEAGSLRLSQLAISAGSPVTSACRHGRERPHHYTNRTDARAERLTPNVAAQNSTVVGQRKAQSSTKDWPCGVELCLPSSDCLARQKARRRFMELRPESWLQGQCRALYT